MKVFALTYPEHRDAVDCLTVLVEALEEPVVLMGLRHGETWTLSPQRLHILRTLLERIRDVSPSQGTELVRSADVGWIDESSRAAAAVLLQNEIVRQRNTLKKALRELQDVQRIKLENDRLRAELSAAGPPEILKEIDALW